MIYLKLFLIFMKIGVLSFGGGYATLSLIQSDIVNSIGWLTSTEFADIVTISQLTPGPIAINAATFVGTHMGGFWGAIIATLGYIFPSIIILTLFAILYKKYNNSKKVQGLFSGMRPAVAGLIAAVAFSLFVGAIWTGSAFSDFDLIAAAIFAGSFLLLKFTKINPIFMLLGAGAVGGIVYAVI